MTAPRVYTDIVIHYKPNIAERTKSPEDLKGVLTDKFTKATPLFSRFNIRINMTDMSLAGQSVSGQMPTALVADAQTELEKHNFFLRARKSIKPV